MFDSIKKCKWFSCNRLYLQMRGEKAKVNSKCETTVKPLCKKKEEEKLCHSQRTKTTWTFGYSYRTIGREGGKQWTNEPSNEDERWTSELRGQKNCSLYNDMHDKTQANHSLAFQVGSQWCTFWFFTFRYNHSDQTFVQIDQFKYIYCFCLETNSNCCSILVTQSWQ